MCAPMSPIWPTPKSRYMFQNRQFMPLDAAEILRAVGMIRATVRSTARSAAATAACPGLPDIPAAAAGGVPAMHGLQFADGAIQNQLAHALEVRIGVALRAVLGGHLGLALEVIRAHRPHFFHA